MNQLNWVQGPNDIGLGLQISLISGHLMVSDQIDVPANNHAPSMARAFTTDTLAAWNVIESRDQIMLAASELVTNAVRHGKAPVTVRLSSQDRCIRLEVGDGSDIAPVTPEPGTGGFGLYLVGKICTRWGVTNTRQGKIVWCECPIGPEA